MIIKTVLVLTLFTGQIVRRVVYVRIDIIAKILGVAFVAASFNALSLQLEKGVTPAMSEWAELTKADRDAGFLPLAVVRSEQQGVVYVYDGGIGESNYINSSLLRGWQLTPYLNHLFLFGEYPAAISALAGARGEEPPEPQPLLTPVSNRSISYSLQSNGPMSVAFGCLSQSPLRYGDVDADSQQELVLFLDAAIVFFSPQQGAITFSYHFWLDDELLIDSAYYNEDSPLMHGITPNDPVYFAESGSDILVMERYPAKRSLTKLYVGDLFQEGRYDMVLWRKLYESRARGAAEGGFQLIGNYYAHYIKQADGVYTPADTEQNQIQNSLASNNLTWLQGYPNQSECAGTENQPIPDSYRSSRLHQAEGSVEECANG